MALTLRDVVVRYGDVRAVDRVSLDLEQGRVLAVLGPSGCGKSTLLRAVAGLEPVTEGSLAFDGRDLARVPTHRRGFALMFQDGQLFAHLSVARNVAYSLRLRGVAAAARASGNGSRWPGRWRSSRGCCSSTSRSRPSTPPCAVGWPSTCARSCAPRARRR